MIGRAGGVSFAMLDAKALELVWRAPSIARLISAQFPVIIPDEHQDASSAQHELAMTLMWVGCSRLRIFGDPMQALHHGSVDQFVDWDALWRDCPNRLELTDPKRWPEAPNLGAWVTTAHAILKAGGTLSMKDAPSEVHLRTTSELAGRNKFRDHKLGGESLHAFLDAGSGRAVVVAHLSEMVRALA